MAGNAGRPNPQIVYAEQPQAEPTTVKPPARQRQGVAGGVPARHVALGKSRAYRRGWKVTTAVGINRVPAKPSASFLYHG